MGDSAERASGVEDVCDGGQTERDEYAECVYVCVWVSLALLGGDDGVSLGV